MGQVHIVRGSRKRLMAYLQSHPEIRQLTLIIAENEDKSSTTRYTETAPPEGVRVLNGVPLFPDLPNMVPVTVEMVKQLLDEEKAPTD
jgi:hypothetical protein